MRGVIVIVAYLTMGCASAFLQTDDFPKKLAKGCSDGKSCRVLVAEAEGRVQRCKANTVGYIRCDDARADLTIARSLLREQELAEKQAEQERRKAERREEEQRQEEARAAEAATRLKEAELQEARRQAEQREREQLAAEKHAREVDRLRYLGKTGRQQELRQCHGGASASATCAVLLDKLIEAAADDAEKGELAQFDQKLRIEASSPKPSPVSSTSSAYSSSSGSSGGRGTTSASSGSGRVLCRDGTVSPSCVCGRSLRGCCSWHGGVAGCE